MIEIRNREVSLEKVARYSFDLVTTYTMLEKMVLEKHTYQNNEEVLSIVIKDEYENIKARIDFNEEETKKITKFLNKNEKLTLQIISGNRINHPQAIIKDLEKGL